MNKYKKLVNNSFIFAIGNFGSRIINIVMVPLYTFYLNTKDYGTVDLVTTTVSLLVPIFSFCIFEAALRYAMDKNKDKEEVFTNSLIIQLILSLSLIVLSPILLGIKSFKGMTIYIIIILILQMYQTLFSQFVRGLGKIRVFALNGIIMTIVTSISNIILIVVFGMGIHGYLLSIVIANIVSIIYLLIKINVFYYFKLEKVNRPLAFEMIKYSIPLIPNTIMWWIINGSSRFFIVYFAGTAANGLFAVANKVPSLLSTVTSIFNQAWQMSAIEEYDSEDKSNFYTNIFDLYSRVLYLGTSFILVILIPLFKLAIGYEFYDSWKLVPFLLLSVTYSSFASFLGTNYVAAKQTSGVIISAVICGIINVILNACLIPIIGVNGAGISSAVSFLILWFIRMYGTRKFVKVNLNSKNFIINHAIIFFQIVTLFVCPSNVKILILSLLFIVSFIFNYSVFKLIFDSIKSKSSNK